MRFLHLAPLLGALTILVSASAANGGDAPVPDPVAAAKKVRAALHPPDEGRGFEFEGDLVLDGDPIGTVKYAVSTGVYHDAPVWIVTQAEEREFAGSTRTTESSLYLAKDLTLIRGETETKTAEATTRISFARAGDGFDLVKNVTWTTAKPSSSEYHVKAAADATSGRPALLLFLRGAPKAEATYTLPLFFPELAANAPATEDDPVVASIDASVDVKGPAKYGTAPHVADTWMVRVRSAFGRYDMHLLPKDRSLVAIAGLPASAGVPAVPDVVPKGTAPKKAETDDDRPATTWKAAFLKFGHGYHMAIPKYLDAAFHWPTMFAHEVEAKSWSPENDGDLSKFKAAWIDEFLKESKHRPRADADGLLYGTLATGTPTQQADDYVVFAAHAQYGGGTQRTYHLKRIEGVWYIVRIDSQE